MLLTDGKERRISADVCTSEHDMNAIIWLASIGSQESVRYCVSTELTLRANADIVELKLTLDLMFFDITEDLI